MLVFVISLFIVLFSFDQLNAELRRDDTWPPPDFLEVLKPISEKCKAETVVTDAAIKEFSDGEVHEDAALKCYMSCLFHEFRVVDDNGDPHFERINTHVRLLDEEIRQIVQVTFLICTNPQRVDRYERAFSIHKCWKTHDPKVCSQ
ncbi:pheromone-binding protein-related protein 6-like [Sitodiplosis mosellana]|uniref:pheromone-binding protein-related protein 6-like n=1 Tax=Sitodiplosis mosellana TaxID=263140 RepID=UPI00244494CD|nr:pheromone-binding protein-related protein 6-like [Sitodiplosis mosellana]